MFAVGDLLLLKLYPSSSVKVVMKSLRFISCDVLASEEDDNLLGQTFSQSCKNTDQKLRDSHPASTASHITKPWSHTVQSKNTAIPSPNMSPCKATAKRTDFGDTLFEMKSVVSQRRTNCRPLSYEKDMKNENYGIPLTNTARHKKGCHSLCP